MARKIRGVAGLIKEARELSAQLLGVSGYVWKKSMSGKQIGAMLSANGWEFTGQEGSHMNYKKFNRSVTVPNHKEIKKGTLSSIKKRVLEIESQK